jgi:hypothetical protein
MGIHIQATRGSGKSTLEAIIALADFVRGYPVVLFEVQGGLVEQLIWRLRELDFGREIRNALLDRIIYADMSGKYGRITSWPFLYKNPGDSLYAVSQRFIELTKKLDPNLSNAPILGSGALDFIATYAGMALFAMGCQLTEAIDLLTYPEKWAGRLRQAADDNKEAEEPVRYFLNEYPNLDVNQRRNQIMTFRNKLAPFTLDPTLRAMFGGPIPGIDWEDVLRHSKLVILDFQDITSDDDMRFRMRWCFSHLWEYLRQRRFAREKPISVILDELAYLLSMKAGTDDLLAGDFDGFINKDMRKRNVWVTAAHQEIYQITNERIVKTLLSMGTQIIGQTGDREAAEMLANTYLEFDPHLVKKTIPRWAVMSRQTLEWVRDEMGDQHPIMWNDQYIKTVDYVTEEYPLEEQREMATAQFLDGSKFRFLVAHSGEEGTLSRDLRLVTIAPLVRMVGFPKEQRVAEDRQLLIERSGAPIEEINSEIEKRLPMPHTPLAPRTTTKVAKVN